MKNLLLLPAVIMTTLIFAGCSAAKVPRNSSSDTVELKPALESITSDDFLRHIKMLSSDEFEGRAPGTRGEDLTIKYLIDQFRQMELKPGNPDGTYLQNVPMVSFKADSKISFSVAGKRMDLKFPNDYVAVSRRPQSEVRVTDSQLVFVGYGVVAPEYGWDDYKGVDVRGKTLVMLINDPPVADPADPSKLNEKIFKGKAMTYYGRWTYKYEIASERGASAAILVHETGPAGYPFEVVVDSWGRENFDINKPEASSKRVSVESWITIDTARRLFSMAGRDFASLKKSAVSKDFKPVFLNAKANFDVKVATRQTLSHNVIARLDGSDPKLKDQYVIYSAHWDHLGKDERLKGDQIYNGALDNASGTAALLELARAFTQLKTPPRRTILFLSVTAEEQGLLGAKYYVENPLYPLAKTVADINMDGMNPWGRTRDIVVIGLGNTTLEDVLRNEARAQGRVMKADPEPEKGFFFRSDHFEFARQGVPAFYTDSGTEFIGKAADYAQKKRDEYTTRDYHKVSDEVRRDWDLSGAVEDLQLLFRTGCRISQDEREPEWKSGAEFSPQRRRD